MFGHECRIFIHGRCDRCGKPAQAASSPSDYLTKHCDDCQCRDTDPKYPTLCELLAVLAQQRRELAQRAKSLALEVQGCLSLDEPELRRVLGNTNYRCLIEKADAVRKLIGGE